MKVNKEERKPNLNSENAIENKEGKALTRLTHTQLGKIQRITTVNGSGRPRKDVLQPKNLTIQKYVITKVIQS